MLALLAWSTWSYRKMKSSGHRGRWYVSALSPLMLIGSEPTKLLNDNASDLGR